MRNLKRLTLITLLGRGASKLIARDEIEQDQERESVNGETEGMLASSTLNNQTGKLRACESEKTGSEPLIETLRSLLSMTL